MRYAYVKHFFRFSEIFAKSTKSGDLAKKGVSELRKLRKSPFIVLSLSKGRKERKENQNKEKNETTGITGEKATHGGRRKTSDYPLIPKVGAD